VVYLKASPPALATEPRSTSAPPSERIKNTKASMLVDCLNLTQKTTVEETVLGAPLTVVEKV
jgi:hypothetical protein